MPSFKLPLAAALVAVAFTAPAAQAEVRRHTVVTRSTVVTHNVDGDHHRSRKVCKNVWSHHRKIHKCSWVRWHD